MNYQIIPVTAFAQNCSVVWCDITGQTVLVDPGGEADKIRQVLSSLNRVPSSILLTHGHLDHVGAATELANEFGISIIGPHHADQGWLNRLAEQSQAFGLPACPQVQPDRWLTEGETISVGESVLEVFHCPGHTPGHIVFFDRTGRLLISGDVLFKGSIGGTHFPESSHTQLMASIQQKLLPLGDDVTFIAGHGPQSTLGEEKRTNPFLR